MIRKTVSLLVLCLAFFTIHAQQVMNKDSLLALLPQTAQDSSRVLLLIHIAEQYEGDDPQRAKQYYRQARQLAEQAHYERGIIKVINGYTYVLNMEGAFDSSAIYNLQAVALSRRLKDTLSLAKCLFNTGTSFRFQGAYAAAVQYFEEGKNYFSKVGNDSLGAIGDDILQGLYTEMREYEKSRIHGERAVAQLRKFSNPLSLGIALNNLGNNYVAMKRFTQAEKAYLEALDIGIKTEDRNLEISQYLNLGDLELQRESYKDLYTYFSKALVMAGQLELQESKALALRGLSYYYQYQHNYTKARELAVQALGLGRQYNLPGIKKQTLKQLAHLAYGMQDPELGNHYDILATVLEDSLLNEQILRNTQELEVKYETVRKEAQISNLKNETQLQQLNIKSKNMLIAFLAALACIVGVVIVLLYRSYQHRQKIQQLRITELETEKQLAAAEAVMKGEEQERARMAKDLHDGLGGMLSGLKYTLNSVRGNMILTHDNALAFERSLDMLDSSIGEMRRIAHNLLPEALIRFGLDNALNGLCQDINESKILQVHYESMGLASVQIVQQKAIVVYRIVQELLNNILKHASATQAIVQLMVTDNKLNVTVEDNGKGFDYSETMQSKGIGWRNIRNRLEFLNGSLYVDSHANKGTSVLIEIQL